MMIIETERLILREMNEGDFDMLFKVLGDRGNMRFYPYIFDEERVRAWIAGNLERYRIFGFGLWAVCLKDSGEMIGDCGITMQNINGFIRPEIGYHIRADKQRMGYAKEAAAAVRDWGFANTPFKVLHSYTTSDNIPSIRTAESMGMKLVESYADKDKGKLVVYAVSRRELADAL